MELSAGDAAAPGAPGSGGAGVAARVRHFQRNHMRIHEAYQYLLKKRIAQVGVP